jgi:hypothetical protein
VRGVTQLLEPAFRTRPFVAMLFQLAYTIRSRIRSPRSIGYWEGMLKKLNMAQPGRSMTEGIRIFCLSFRISLAYTIHWLNPLVLLIFRHLGWFDKF